MKTNILVQYQGGGYDGCIWEWNYFFIDKQGMFHDIESSGRGAITTIEQAKELLDSDDTHYIYDITNDDSIADFSKECNPVHIAGVLKWFNDYNDPDIDFFAICSECGCEITDYDDLSLEKWHSCGGIVSWADSLICHECRLIGTCDNCSEYVSDEHIFPVYQVEIDSDLCRDNKYMYQAARAMIDDGLDRVCEYCLDNRAAEIEKEEHDDLLFQSLLTGKPDLFSDEMRWLWD